MATVVLQTVGSVLGAAVAGPVGGAFGRILGGLGGGLMDLALAPKASPRFEIGPRLKAMDGVTSTEGAPIPRIYGRARVGGQMIWATRFLEVANVEVDQGGGGGGQGKGGGQPAPVYNVRYSYFANFAIAVCEGEIAFIRRIWADGVELDLTTLPIRIYTGDDRQEPDPLIAAKEGADNAPAYRGLAYVVFDTLPLARFGDRVPQFTFEVVKPVQGLGAMVRAIDLIPGASEAGYQPSLQLNFSSPGSSNAENRHQLTASTDWIASIDALQALCPNLENVALVVAWFGDDLRAGQCTITPRVDARFKTIGEFDNLLQGYWPPDWSVQGMSRAAARLVSQVGGRSAYGGTPSDASVVAAIRDLKARGLKVTFYPFVMMDIPSDNALPDPGTGVSPQPPYPWRGRVTCFPAPGAADTVDGAAAAADQVNAFFTQFNAFIRHCAQLCVDAGGVDAFFIGSELVGLTRVRSGPGTYPAVSALISLAAEIKAKLGSHTKLSYAADWTEYGSHVPASGELRFPLDPLWASQNVDFVGIDAYWPLSDWRDGVSHLDAKEAASIYDLDYLRARVTSGEAFDWYYATLTDRIEQRRTPITDALGKPWVYRQKDLVSWWSNAHHERVGGVEVANATAWVPQSKPIWIAETGCPAVDRGANSPNVFPDARSSEGGLPHFSRDGRDDLMQARFLEAMMSHFAPAAPDLSANPVSSIYNGAMVDPSRIYLWCWDARPFPAFPSLGSVWSDGANWETGHWLNGRLEGAPLDRLAQVLAQDTAPDADAIERPNIDGFVDGYVIDRPMSAREAIEPLTALYGFDLVATGEGPRFVSRRGAAVRRLDEGDFAQRKEPSFVTLTRTQESELPHEIALTFADSERDYQLAQSLSRRVEGYTSRRAEAQSGLLTHRSNAQRLVNIWLQDLWAGREGAEFELRPGLVDLEVGDIVALGVAGRDRLFQILRIADGRTRLVSARAVDPSVYDAPAPRLYTEGVAGPTIYGPARVLFLDLAIARDDPATLGFVAAFCDPWPGPLAIWKVSSGASEFVARIDRRATIGDTLDVLKAGPTGRFDRGSSVTVKLGGGALASVSDADALAGKTAMAIRGADGSWEIFSFAQAELIAANTYRLSRLIRGLGGEEHLAQRDVAAGAPVVLLNSALAPVTSKPSQLGVSSTYRIGPADRGIADPLAVEATHTVSDKALKPYAPTRLRAARTQAGVMFRFVRRSRIDADGWETIDVPLGEASEAYEMDIALPGGGVRTLSAAEPQILYANVQELADFGAPQTSFEARLFQISASVGRGFPLHARLTL